MAIPTHITAVGIFEDRRQAERAVHELRWVGFTADQIGVAGREMADEPERDSYAGEGGLGGVWAIGIAAGMLPAIGPVIAGGLLASLLTSAAGGAAAGGLLGALVGLGIPEEEAKYYEDKFQSGQTLVTVQADERYDEARAILDRYGSCDWTSWP
jgi:hypothetical protein